MSGLIRRISAFGGWRRSTAGLSVATAVDAARRPLIPLPLGVATRTSLCLSLSGEHGLFRPRSHADVPGLSLLAAVAPGKHRGGEDDG